jgi:hypothetical protein
MYIWNKGSIVGPALKIPFIGPFLESVNPNFNVYHAKWKSGSLSCVSVFHKYDHPYPSQSGSQSAGPRSHLSILTHALQVRRHCLDSRHGP